MHPWVGVTWEYAILQGWDPMDFADHVATNFGLVSGLLASVAVPLFVKPPRFGTHSVTKNCFVCTMACSVLLQLATILLVVTWQQNFRRLLAARSCANYMMKWGFVTVIASRAWLQCVVFLTYYGNKWI